MRSVCKHPTGKACFIHTLKRAIYDAFAKMSIITIVVGRRIVTHLNHSKPAQENLKLIQTKLNAQKHQLIQDVSTYWNSIY